jgi:hypothetical protein
MYDLSKKYIDENEIPRHHDYSRGDDMEEHSINQITAKNIAITRYIMMDQYLS